MNAETIVIITICMVIIGIDWWINIMKGKWQ